MSERFREALVFADELHDGQTRKQSTIPYVSHLLAVAATVLEFGGNEDQAIAALFHDAAEDQGGQQTLDQIRARFGDAVANMVAACTDTFEDPKPPWRGRKEAFIASLAGLGGQARLIVAADKLHNAQSCLRDFGHLGDVFWERFTGGRDGSLWYYRGLADALLVLGPQGPARELNRVVSALEEMADGDN